MHKSLIISEDCDWHLLEFLKLLYISLIEETKHPSLKSELRSKMLELVTSKCSVKTEV